LKCSWASCGTASERIIKRSRRADTKSFLRARVKGVEFNQAITYKKLMAKLLSRQKQVPGGFRFSMPALKWNSTPWASFDSIVQSIISARNGNPHLTQKYGWATDVPSVEAELDDYNARICEMMGYADYITSSAGAAPPPKPMPPQHSPSQLNAVAEKARKIWAGVKTLNDWLDSGEPAVAQELSESRAATCAACPLNGKGDFETWFTKPASESIRKQLEKAHSMNLSTTHDAQIDVCTACLCPSRLKVHTPMKFITPHLKPEVIEALRGGNRCWILQETGQ
jgi:hypothetical protein